VNCGSDNKNSFKIGKRVELFEHKMAAKFCLQSYEKYAIIFAMGVATHFANAGD